MKQFLITLSLFFVYHFISAQNYPVQANFHVAPPYTSYIPDYLDAGNSKMQLVLDIKDIKVTTLKVRLKFIMEGPGGRIESKDILPLAPIHLVQGESTILSGPDLAPYLLNPNNLNFPNQQLRNIYTQSTMLTEGMCPCSAGFAILRFIVNQNRTENWFGFTIHS